MSRRTRRMAEVERRLALTEMRLRNLFAETAMMVLYRPGGCPICNREGNEGHCSSCDFHSSFWSHPEDTIWNCEGQVLPDAPDDEPVCAPLDAQSPNEVRP